MGDSDSAHQSSLTSVGVAWTPDNTDNLVYDVDEVLNNLASSARLQRPVNAHSYLYDTNDNHGNDDACYRTLADNMTAGAYQIKLDD